MDNLVGILVGGAVVVALLYGVFLFLRKFGAIIFGLITIGYLAEKYTSGGVLLVSFLIFIVACLYFIFWISNKLNPKKHSVDKIKPIENNSMPSSNITQKEPLKIVGFKKVSRSDVNMSDLKLINQPNCCGEQFKPNAKFCSVCGKPRIARVAS